MIVLKINVGKIDKSKMFKGDKGTYLDCVLKDNKDGRDKFGNDGFIVQSIPKEEREAGGHGEIIGNWKRLGGDKQKPLKPVKHEEPADDDDIPF